MKELFEAFIYPNIYNYSSATGFTKFTVKEDMIVRGNIDKATGLIDYQRSKLHNCYISLGIYGAQDLSLDPKTHCFTYESMTPISSLAQFVMDLFVKIMQPFMYEEKDNNESTQTQLILKSHNLILDADTKHKLFTIFRQIIDQKFHLDCYIPEVLDDSSLEPTLSWEDNPPSAGKRKRNSKLD